MKLKHTILFGLLFVGCSKKPDGMMIKLGSASMIEARGSTTFRIEHNEGNKAVFSLLYVTNATDTNISISFPGKLGVVTGHSLSIFRVASFGKLSNEVNQIDLK